MERITMKITKARRKRTEFAVLVLFWVGFLAQSACGQVSNDITSVVPDSASLDTSGLLVTFTLDSDVPPPPPAGEMPDSVTIGGLSGTSVTHSSQYTVTAVFDIPASEVAGAKDVAIDFTTPNGTVTFSKSGGFTVTAGADTPPAIVTHPKSQTAPSGSRVTFSVTATGTEPLEYQWYNDSGAVTGAEGSSLTINPVAESDAGNYWCVVANDFGLATSSAAVLTVAELPTGAYTIVDTGQDTCYDDISSVTCPAEGSAFYGQDGQYTINAPSFAISGDGLTIYDNVTGLTWTRSPDLDSDGDIDLDDKPDFYTAQDYPALYNAQNFGGYDDWRVPNIKELYSLIDFRGTDPAVEGDDTTGLIPFIDTDYFEFSYGITDAGERVIDSQFVTTSQYVGTVFGDESCVFGVNLADGRIKCYPLTKAFCVYLVRGNPDYGVNILTDNGDDTVFDEATGLMWSQDDDGGSGMNWEDALAWAAARNAENYLGYSDWRLPNAKELQSIVDYTRAPDVTDSATIDPVFNTTQLINLAGNIDYPFYWSGTTHLSFNGSAERGVYVAFGRGMGTMDGTNIIDVHGAGCQRSDPKDGDESDYPSWGNGPQGDVQRVFNNVRLVRGPFCKADQDRDGNIDLDDYSVLSNCLSGPGIEPAIACNQADLDEDGDVDLADFAELTADFGESEVSTYPYCTN